jgi:hypothetical protein
MLQRSGGRPPSLAPCAGALATNAGRALGIKSLSRSRQRPDRAAMQCTGTSKVSSEPRSRHQRESGGMDGRDRRGLGDRKPAAARAAYVVPGTNQRLLPGQKLGNKYHTAHLPVVRRRLCPAGVRLAMVLNEALSGD